MNTIEDNEHLLIDLSEDQPPCSFQNKRTAQPNHKKQEHPAAAATVDEQPSCSHHYQQQQQQQAKGTTFFTIVQIIENLFLLGVDSLTKWEKLIKHLKSDYDVISNPLLRQLNVTLTQLLKVFQNKINTNPDVCNEGTMFAEYDVSRSYDELLEIFQPVLQTSVVGIAKYPMPTIQILLTTVRLMLKQNKRKSCDENLKSSKRKSKQLNISKYVNSESSSDNESFHDDDDDDDSFAKLFKKSKHEPLVISQQFIFQSGDVRKKISTPGETGTHLIKIEISDVKDLKKCKSEKFYWQKVSKKGYFLLNKNKEDEGEILNLITNILTEVGQKVLKLKHVKKESVKFDRNKD